MSQVRTALDDCNFLKKYIILSRQFLEIFTKRSAAESVLKCI
jgi:hypothetical protein